MQSKMTLYLLKANLKLKVKSKKKYAQSCDKPYSIKLNINMFHIFLLHNILLFLKYIFFQADVIEMKPKIQKKREMDEDSSDTKKIKTDEKILDVRESEPIISSKEISSKKNVCLFNIFNYL